MTRLNCWEYMRCGREPGGVNAGGAGVCPAAVEETVTGINGGTNGGRACWAIAGTLCGGEKQGTFAAKIVNCLRCSFYKTVVVEEGYRFVTSREITARLGNR